MFRVILSPLPIKNQGRTLTKSIMNIGWTKGPKPRKKFKMISIEWEWNSESTGLNATTLWRGVKPRVWLVRAVNYHVVLCANRRKWHNAVWSSIPATSCQFWGCTEYVRQWQWCNIQVRVVESDLPTCPSVAMLVDPSHHVQGNCGWREKELLLLF